MPDGIVIKRIANYRRYTHVVCAIYEGKWVYLRWTEMPDKALHDCQKDPLYRKHCTQFTLIPVTEQAPKRRYSKQ